MLKAQMEREIARLTAELAASQARETGLLKAMEARYIVGYSGKRYVAVALTSQELDQVQEAVKNRAYDCFDGGTAMTFEEDYRLEDLLPNIKSYHASFAYSNEDGISGVRVWGLVQVPQPCSRCKETRLQHSYGRCQKCHEAIEAEYAVDLSQA